MCLQSNKVVLWTETDGHGLIDIIILQCTSASTVTRLRHSTLPGLLQSSNETMRDWVKTFERHSSHLQVFMRRDRQFNLPIEGPYMCLTLKLFKLRNIIH